MPAPGEDEAAYKKRKAKEKAEAEKKKKYKAKIDPSTVEEQVSAEELRAEVFKEGEWRPNWAIVEFVRLHICSLLRLSSPGLLSCHLGDYSVESRCTSSGVRRGEGDGRGK